MDPNQDAFALLELISKPYAAHILRTLAQHGPLHFGDIVSRTGIPTATATRHLAALSTAGLITIDLPAEQRRGRALQYDLNRDKLRDAMDEVSKALAL